MEDTTPIPLAADAEPIKTTPKAAFPWRSVLLVASTIALTVALAFIPKGFLESLGNYGYIGLFVFTLLSSATLVLPSPAIGLSFVAGSTLNPWLVGIISGVAAALGEITGYMAGMGGNAFAQRTTFYTTIERFVSRWGMLTIFVLAIIPSPLFDFAGIAAGTMRMPFWRYLAACLAGKTLRFIGIAWLGRMAPDLIHMFVQ